MILRTLALALAIATSAVAHLVKVDPSTCALAIGLSAPDAALTATVDPPGADELLRVSYEPDSSATRSRVLACPADPGDPAGRCGAVVPRGFTLGAQAGSIALPTAFAMRMLSTGDLDAQDVPVTITLDGTLVTVPFDLTTGITRVGGTTVLGAPIDASGAVALVGTGTSLALPAPLGGAALRLDLACTLAPLPDRDQFAQAPRLGKIRGVFTARTEKLVVLLESDVSTPIDPTGLPTVLRLDASTSLLDETIALQPSPRGRFASDDGAVTVRVLARRAVRLQKIVLRRSVSQAGATFSGGDGHLVVASGGLFARRGVALRANGRGTRLTVREQ